MLLPKFKLEEYFAKYEFVAPYMLGSSDAQSHSLHELLNLADEDARHLWNNLSFSYTETHGLPLLRQEIANCYETIDIDDVLVCSGAEEAIYITFQILLKPKSHVVVITPCYQSLKTLPKALGAELTELPLVLSNEGWKLDLNALKNAVRENTQLIIVNFPHNPTSYLADHTTYKEIIKLAKNVNAYLFSDEVYRYSEQLVADRLPAACDFYEKAISLGVMSKSLGLPGLRIGWLATRNKEVLEKVAAYKNYLTICNSAPSEILSVIALRAKEKIIARNMQIIKSNLVLLEKFFAKYRGIFDWHKPRGGITAFPRLKHGISIDDYAVKLVEEQGVLILPGSLYDYSGNHFRLGFGRSNMPEALSRLEIFVDNMMRKL